MWGEGAINTEEAIAVKALVLALVPGHPWGAPVHLWDAVSQRLSNPLSTTGPICISPDPHQPCCPESCWDAFGQGPQLISEEHTRGYLTMGETSARGLWVPWNPAGPYLKLFALGEVHRHPSKGGIQLGNPDASI